MPRGRLPSDTTTVNKLVNDIRDFRNYGNRDKLMGAMQSINSVINDNPNASLSAKVRLMREKERTERYLRLAK